MQRLLPATYRTLLLVFVLIVIAFLVLILFRNLSDAAKSSQWVEHTYNVLLKADNLSIDLRDVDLATLRYVISGIDQRLELYETASADVPKALADLRRLVSDSAAQQARIDELSTLIAVRMEILRKRVQTRRSQGQAAAQDLIKTDAGQSAGRRIRALLNGLTTQEQALLQQRKQLATRQFNRTLQLMGVGSVVLLALLICINYILESDVVLRRKAEQEVRRSEIQFRSMFDNASVGIALLSGSGQFQLVNSRFCEITGYSREQLLERTFQSITFPDDLPEFSLLSHLAEPGVSAYGKKKRCLRGDGSPVWVNLRASSLPASLDTPQRFISIIEDVNAQVQAEEVLQAANESLLRSNESLQEFAYVASHDLQEPLRTVSMYSQLLFREYKPKLDERGENFLNVISDSARRMSQLIESLLAYSQASTADKENFQPVNLRDLLNDVLASLRARLEEENAVIDCDPLPIVCGDPVRLHQVFQNLIGNSLKYRRQDVPPKIQISCEERPTEWLFRIRDNGLGFQPQFAERIFGIFKRLHRNQISGTGIGLAVVKTVVQRHGGRVWAESPGDNQGATFNFTIPAALEPSPTEHLLTNHS